MTRPFNQVGTTLLLALPLSTAFLLNTGCRSMSLAVAQPALPTKVDPPQIDAALENEVMAEDNIKALESFLARTETYSLAPAGTTKPVTEKPVLVHSVEPSKEPAQRQQKAIPQYENPGIRAATAAPRVVFAGIVEPQPLAPTMPHANETLAVTRRSAQILPSAAPIVKLISIRDTVRDDVVMSDSLPTVQANEPAQDLSVNAWGTLDELLAKLIERAVNGQDVGATWEAGLIHAIVRKPLDAGSISHALSHSLKPLFLTTIDLVRSLRRVVEENPADVGDTLDQLEALHRMIANKADPSVDAIAMCREVTTFGVFEEMSMAEFVAGRATPTIIYSELENLSAQKEAGGSYRTELATRLEIFTAEGQSVLSREEPKIVDLCRRHRRDFFIAQRITLPASMQPGDYVLKVFVEDKLAGRAAEGSYPFTIGMRTASIRN